MNEQHIEDIISSIYDMVQEARAMPLAADKCIVERDKVLDMLDELISQFPNEIKQARTIVESRRDDSAPGPGEGQQDGPAGSDLPGVQA